MVCQNVCINRYTIIYVTQGVHSSSNIWMCLFLSRFPAAVGTVTSLRSGRSLFWFPASEIYFSLLQIIPSNSGARPTSDSMNKEILSPGVKGLEREADQSPQSSAEVKNEWSLPSVPPNSRHAVERKNLTLSSTSEGSNMLWIKYPVQTNKQTNTAGNT